MRGKKGQTAFGVLFSLFIFTVVWIAGLASWIGEMGQAMVIGGNLTGLNAFFYSNLNLFIGICLFLAYIAVAKWGFG